VIQKCPLKTQPNIVNHLLLLFKDSKNVVNNLVNKLKSVILAGAENVRRFLEEKPSLFSQCSLQLAA